MPTRFRRCLLALSALLACTLVHARTITDMQGRSVEIPDHIEKVFGAAPPVTGLLHTLAPDTLIGLNMPFPPGSDAFISERELQLPVLGSTMGHGRQINPETLLQLGPQLAIGWGGKAPRADTEHIAEQYRRLGIPVIFLTLDTLDDWPAAYRLVGQVLGREARAETLARYIEDALARVRGAVGPLAAAQRLPVYYAQGPDGLATECDTSFHVEPVLIAGGDNVYHCQQRQVMGQEKVSLEQVLGWQPRVMVVQDRAFLQALPGDVRWADVPAVREQRVLAVPLAPYNWLDRPPSFARALGIQWLAHAFYPERFPLDVEAAASGFYTLFYGRSPDPAAIKRLLRGHSGHAGQHPMTP